ncbi:hypothetical protein TNCV_596361 [Trichonephila clavipes]|nr:hypothetical protein TNCV_596361 [Trichonephila clavipes]
MGSMVVFLSDVIFAGHNKYSMRNDSCRYETTKRRFLQLLRSGYRSVYRVCPSLVVCCIDPRVFTSQPSNQKLATCSIVLLQIPVQQPVHRR